jgi:hypothetical protein
MAAVRIQLKPLLRPEAFFLRPIQWHIADRAFWHAYAALIILSMFPLSLPNASVQVWNLAKSQLGFTSLLGTNPFKTVIDAFGKV